MRIQKILIFFLLIISCFFLLYHHLNYQPMLSPGDHGRDLYGFQATMQGKVSYHDYWWTYGPIMPYYYASFFKVFGVSIKTVLLGKFILNLVSGIFFFLALSLFIPQIIAFIGALWFWIFSPDFFFTYNHAAGITMLMATIYTIFLYIKNDRIKYLYWALLSILILSLVKINFGLVALFICILTVFSRDKINKTPLTRQKKQFYLLAIVALPALIFLAYYLFVRGLPFYYIRQCLPYFSSDHPHHASILVTIQMWWDAIALNINANGPNRFIAILIIFSTLATLHEIIYTKEPLFSPPADKTGQKAAAVDAQAQAEQAQPFKWQILLVIAVLILFYVMNLHEFLVSGVLYRTFWAKPFSFFLIFLFIGFASRNYSKTIRILLFLTLFVLVFLRYTEQVDIVRTKNSDQYLTLERGQIITGNSPMWINTVTQTTQFLQARLKDDETFFALPYDPLYYYLTDKPTPTRQIIFFEHIKITPEQEKLIIEELKQNNVAYVLLSSRMNSGERGLGILGQTYCPEINRYIFNNFEPIIRFGDWVNPPGWAWNHGTMIMQRKTE